MPHAGEKEPLLSMESQVQGWLLAPQKLRNQFIRKVVLGGRFYGIPIVIRKHPVGSLQPSFNIKAGDPMQSLGYASEIVNLIIAVILYFSAFALIVGQYIAKLKKE